MGNKHPLKESKFKGGKLGKVITPLNEKLKSVEWGEFELDDLFDSSNGNFDLQKTHINGKGNYVITAGLTDNGVMGKTDIEAKVFDEKTITIDMFGAIFYRQFKYKMVTHARVFSLKPKFPITEKQGLFIVNSFHFLSKKFGYENMCSWEKIKSRKIQLPTKNGKIDFEFMESFIVALEVERIEKLNKYLNDNELSKYNLTENEKQALDNFEELKWGEFKLVVLFDRIKTKKLPFKVDELSKQMEGNYTLPCLTSSFKNQGLNYFAPKDGATILKNVISLPSNSDVYRAYFQSNEFTVLSDAYAIRWILDDAKLKPNQYLFAVQGINKVTDLPIYSYKNKLGGWNVVKNKYIQLPIKNNKPDYEIMDTLISAIKKMEIKDVVLYVEKKNI